MATFRFDGFAVLNLILAALALSLGLWVLFSSHLSAHRLRPPVSLQLRNVAFLFSLLASTFIVISIAGFAKTGKKREDATANCVPWSCWGLGTERETDTC